MVLTRGMVPVGLGLLGGLLIAVVGVAALDSLLYGVKALDPATFAAAFASLTCSALVACAIPAWRASRTDPATILRAE